MNNVLQLTSQLYSIIGFIIQPVSFEKIVSPDFRKALKNDFNGSIVSRMMIAMPDFFVVNKTVEPAKSAFFIKVLLGNDELPKDVEQTYLTYFPSEVQLLRFIPNANLTLVKARWLKEHKEKSLFDFLENNGFGDITDSQLCELGLRGIQIQ